MFYDGDEDHFLFRHGPASRDRRFVDGNDESPANREAWAAAIAATASGDAAAMAAALARVSGEVAPLSSKNKPRLNPLAKAVMRLRSNPAAWARLRRAHACSRFGFGAPDDLQLPDSEWLPESVDALDYMWAANPAALAGASTSWRQECERQGRWPSCPFLAEYWTGPIAIKSLFSHEARRLFHKHLHILGAPPPAPDTEDSRVERDALARILTQTALGCIQQLWSHELLAGQTRAAGGTVWARNQSVWGLDWLDSHLDWIPRSGRPDSIRRTRQPDASARAVDEAMAEALAESPESGLRSARRMALSLSEHHDGDLALRALSALEADPRARALPLPFGAHDWMPPQIVSRVPASDDKLARWLAEVGRYWSAPGHASFDMGIGPRSAIAPAAPKWSHQAHRFATPPPFGMDSWTMLEWMPLLGRPLAARRACQLGAALHPQYEQAIAAPTAWSFSTTRAEVAAIAEACRLAEATPIPADPAPPQAMRL